MTRVLIITTALALIGLMHWALWVFGVKAASPSPPLKNAARVLLILLGAIAPLCIAALMLLRHPAAQLVAVGVFSWLSIAMVLTSLLLVTKGPLAAYVRFTNTDVERRVFLSRAVVGTASVVTGTAAGFALRSATGPAEISEVPIKLARLPPQLSGFTLAQITDLHVGPTIRERQVDRVVEQTNALKPDLIAITGDLVDGSVEQLGSIVGRLARLQARYGVVFITGNHEYYSGADAWAAELTRLGIKVLRNERITIGDAASFDLAGIDDYAAAPDLPRALEGRDPDRSLVLLAHQPRTAAVEEAVRAGVELQISGHTHGGQIAPFNLAVGAMFPYLRGLYRCEAGQVYVSRGTGYWGPPLRLFSPPEIAKLVLTT